MEKEVILPNTDGSLVLVTKYGEKIEVYPKNGSWPIAVMVPFKGELNSGCCYPIFDGFAHKNLYGRLMTIIEAVIEDKTRQKAVKDIIAKELGNFGRDLSRSAIEIADGGDSSENIYNR